jgi:hypothetical protein
LREYACLRKQKVVTSEAVLIVAPVGELLRSETEELQLTSARRETQVALLLRLDPNSDGGGLLHRSARPADQPGTTSEVSE